MSERLAQTPRLRDSTPADLEAIERLYAHHVRHGTGSFELEPPTLAEVTRRRDDVLANGFAHRVAEAGGEVAGISGTVVMGPYWMISRTVRMSIAKTSSPSAKVRYCAAASSLALGFVVMAGILLQ